MQAERWQRAWSHFDDVICLPPEQRSGWLANACRDDPDLERLVTGWLHADASTTDFLTDGWLAREVIAAPDLVGRTLGSCRITERIGQGGMGTVYLAQQTDEIFDRPVAVKVLSFRPFGTEAQQRFQTEQQALGRVDHPAVARIYANGSTEEGFPYLVLEYVPGEPLDQYCERRALSVAERVALFRHVCRGVSASHQRLIVHSDLKPSNILVREDGQPKLLDFGIASLLDPTANESHQEPLGRPLTPQYASPEQLRGEAVTTASDVYSLGVVLHQILCGQRPETRDGTLVPPSEHRASRPRWARALRGDLDSIVRRALAPDPGARYPSVESLDQDLGRFLNDLPVESRSAGHGYRLGKWIRRHRWPVAALTAAFAALLAVSGGLWLGQVRIEQERRGLLEVADFFFGVFEQAGPWVAEGVDISLKDALARSADHLADGPEGEPGIHAALTSVLGEIYLELGEPEQALDWSRRAHTLHASLRGPRSREAAASLDLVGAARRELGDLELAEQANRAALATLRTAAETDPRLLVRSLNNQVHLLCWREDYRAAAPTATEALALARTKLGQDDAETIEALLQQAQVTSHVGEASSAVALYQEAQALLERRYPAGHPQLALLHNNLARIYADQGRSDDEIDQLERADRMYEAMLGPDHYQRVKPLLGLAAKADQRGDIERAATLYQRAAKIGRRTRSASYILRPTASYAKFLVAQGRCREAEDALRASLAKLEARPQKPWRYFDAQSLLGESLMCQDRFQEAAVPLRQSLEGLEPVRDRASSAYERAARRLQRLTDLTG